MFINANYLWTVETNDTPYNWNPDNIIRIINPREMSHPVIENDIIYIQFNSLQFNLWYNSDIPCASHIKFQLMFGQKGVYCLFD